MSVRGNDQTCRKTNRGETNREERNPKRRVTSDPLQSQPSTDRERHGTTSGTTSSRTLAHTHTSHRRLPATAPVSLHSTTHTSLYAQDAGLGGGLTSDNAVPKGRPLCSSAHDCQCGACVACSGVNRIHFNYDRSHGRGSAAMKGSRASVPRTTPLKHPSAERKRSCED